MSRNSSAGSIGAAFKQTLRRVSSAMLPRTLVQLDGMHVLKESDRVSIHAIDSEQILAAIDAYTTHNDCRFRPIDFAIATGSGRLLTAQLVGAKFVLLDASGTRRLATLKLVDDDTWTMAELRHPFAGQCLFSFVQTPSMMSIQNADTDDVVCEIRTSTYHRYTSMLLACTGCLFSADRHDVFKADTNVWLARISAQPTFFNPLRAFIIDFAPICDEETRMLIVCFALLQLLDNAHSELVEIINNQRMRRRIQHS